MSSPATAISSAAASPGSTAAFNGREKPMAVRQSNILAAKAVADVIRSSLGPRGMDKMIRTSQGATIITNDGATILSHMCVQHPAARMLVELSAAQDVTAGDGTTSVVVLAGSLLAAAERLLQQGIHPSILSDAFKCASEHAIRILRDELAIPVNFGDRDTLLQSAVTSLNSKVVAPYANLIANIAVDAVSSVTSSSANVLQDIKVIKKVGGTMDDTKLVEGLLLSQHPTSSAGGPARMERARIALIQFCISPPKTDMEGSIVISDYQQMDRVLAEERAYLLNICKRIKKTGCNVLLVQKSILRDALSEMALQFLSRLRILVITDIERDEVEFISRSLGVRPVADIEGLAEDRLAAADLVEQINHDGVKYTHISGLKNPRRTASILVRGASEAFVDEAARSLHDSLCVLRCLVREPFLICGGGAPEVLLAMRLESLANTLVGPAALAVHAFAQSLLAIPTILAENAGLSPMNVLTELRAAHHNGHTSFGINVRRNTIGDMHEERVLQPLLVSSSAISLASQTVAMILKIDDIVAVR